jgi:hypothetical protein
MKGKKFVVKFEPVIFIRDSGISGNPIIKSFEVGEEAKAEKYLEKHDRPEDLTCEFEPNYLKRRVLL